MSVAGSEDGPGQGAGLEADLPVGAGVAYSAPKINPPDRFNFGDPGSWSRWKSRWARYRAASGLRSRPDADQINSLIYTMGEEAEDVLLSRQIPEDNYANVLAAFDDYFGVRRNLIADRVTFNRMTQGSDTVDVFINRLYRQAEYCEYGALREELIRDRLVAGVSDDYLCDKLQAERDLTLDRAVHVARQHEASKNAKGVFRPGQASVGTVHAHKLPKKPSAATKQRGKATMVPQGSSVPRVCSRCGREPHAKEECPAVKTHSQCKKCGKHGHWAKMCKSTAHPVHNVDEQLRDLHLGETAGEPNCKPWVAQIGVTIGKWSSSQEFKLDSGAAATVCGPGAVRGKLAKPDRKLFGPGSTLLQCLGTLEATLSYGGKKVREKIYVIKAQATNLLSKNACEKLELLQCAVASVDHPVFKGLGTTAVPYKIQLEEDAQPHAIYVPRPVPLPLLEKTRAELNRMLSLGVIEEVTEPTEWCSPMVVIPKGDTVRVCSDVTQLNKYVKREVHPMATVEESLAKLGGGTIFSKLDANSGFWQIPLDPSSVHLTAFLTPFGRYVYRKLMFGLCSAPEVFCRQMNQTLEGCEGVVIHVDDILVMGRNQKEHDQRLDAVLKRIEAAGMTLNKDKCVFSQPSVSFLGYRIDRDGIHAGDRIKAIRDFPQPQNVKDVQSFLGLANQYARFSPKLAEFSTPIRELLKKGAPWIWDRPQQDSFDKLRKEFESPPVLAAYRPDRETIVATDASNHGVGAILSQIQEDGSRRLVAAASRSLTSAEQKYAAIEKEALGVTWALEKFSRYVVGLRDLKVETDHKPLVSLLGGQEMHKLPARIVRFKLRLMRFVFTIHHVPGKLNVSADALSRHPSENATKEDEIFVAEVEDFTKQLVVLPATDVRLEELRKAQQADEVLGTVGQYVDRGWPAYISSADSILKPYYTERGLITRWKGLLVHNNRVIIPQAERMTTMKQIHEGHLGMQKCIQRAQQVVWWPTMAAAIREMVQSCNTCKRYAPKVIEPLRPTETPERAWQVVGVDLFYCRGSTHLLVTDYYSRYPEVVTLRSESAADVIQQMKYIFARHGIPETVVSDNGPQFACQEFRRFAETYKFRTINSSPRYPQANGAVERMVRTVKGILKKSDDPALGLLAYRTSPLQGELSPAELLMNRQLRSNLGGSAQPQVIIDGQQHADFRRKNDEYKTAMERNYNSSHRAHDLPALQSGDRVFIRDSQKEGVVSQPEPAGTRRYAVTTDSGTIRRNRSALVELDRQEGIPNEAPNGPPDESHQEPTKMKDSMNSPTCSPDTPRRSRYGRRIKPVQRYVTMM